MAQACWYRVMSQRRCVGRVQDGRMQRVAMNDGVWRVWMFVLVLLCQSVKHAGCTVTGTGGEDGVPIPKVIGFGPSGSWLTRRGKVVINNAKPLIQIRASAVHSRNYPALGLLAQISVLISSCIVLASTSPLRISNRLEIQRLCIIPHRYAIASAAI